MTIQKKSLINTLNTTKKAIVATQVDADAPATKNAAQQSPARKQLASHIPASKNLARRAPARKSLASHAPARKSLASVSFKKPVL